MGNTHVADDGTIFGVIAVVSGLEQPGLRGLRYRERHFKHADFGEASKSWTR